MTDCKTKGRRCNGRARWAKVRDRIGQPPHDSLQAVADKLAGLGYTASRYGEVKCPPFPEGDFTLHIKDAPGGGYEGVVIRRPIRPVCRWNWTLHRWVLMGSDSG